ncbi:MAG: hypothetical protein CSA18_01060 [Deltaproteobacteria bacterium]|nr:MAG: hypothetical protein CSA18_01060 [Deltaproteobacteria bacterium]
MKRASGLYEMIADYDNIVLAFVKASRGKKGKSEVIDFYKNLEKNIYCLKNQFETGNFDLGHYYFFKINDPKPRNICASSFPERVIHHAVMNICEPFFDSFSISSSYACRKKKGMHKAVYDARKKSLRYPWFLKLDIKKYFDSIDHQILKDLILKKFKDKKLIHLFYSIINSFNSDIGKGIPIGNLLSQYFANYYLGFFDHFIKDEKRIKGYLRYMDDFIIFGDKKAFLKDILEETRIFLSDNLKLDLKDNIILNRSIKGIPFLGLNIFPHKTILSPPAKKRFVKKFKKYEHNYKTGLWTEFELIRHIEPLIGFTLVSDCRNFRNDIIKKYGVIF